MLNQLSDEDRELVMYAVTARARSAPPASARLFMIAPMRTLVLVLDLGQRTIRRIRVENEAGRPCELSVSIDTNLVYSVMYHAQAWQLYGDA